MSGHHPDCHDHHDHEHGHEHSSAGAQGHHGHSHGYRAGQDRIFAISIGLNLVIVVAEAVYGVLGNSIALLADAGHNLGDVLSLLAAWAATMLARRQPTRRFTYGLGHSSILAALANALLLLLVTGAIAWEAILRFWQPEPVAAGPVMAVAALAILGNGLSALLLMRGSQHDLNMRAAFWHMVADAGVSAGVVVSGGLILLTNWVWLDPLASLLVSAVIVIGTWRVLAEAVGLALQAVPLAIEPAKVRAYLESLPGVDRIHDLHIWPMSTTETALTCHLVIPSGAPGDAFMAEISQALHDRFAIAHATLQVETGDPAYPCALVPDHVV